MTTLLAFVRFCGIVARASLSNPPPVRRIVEEAHGIGVRSLPILLVVSAFVGTNLAVQGYNAFAPLGGERLIGMFVALAGVRELAPVMVAAMVAAKAGTEMASQIAVMRIGEQIDALEVMALSPHWFLVTPRLVGILLVIPALTMISIFTLVLCSYGVAVYQLGLDGNDFIQLAAATTRPVDLLSCAAKSLVFGAIICLVSCFYGFHTRPGPAGVGQATNAAVVVSAVSCAALNYVLSEVLFG
ncbi:MAG: ABC transporter permease [Alphaproteobacteria bacterium]|nr:ABC transporter permease [Alphaproteobacteria bacterium]MCB9693486.1 ABC transporter permease [Alphaproteobacteria bacterium]